MATEEIEISQLELAEDLAPDMVLPVETPSKTFATTLEKIRQFFGLDNKTNLNMDNLNVDGKSLISGLGMPSDECVVLTLGASGTTYTAPANGWFYLSKTAGKTDAYISLVINGSFGQTIHVPGAGNQNRTFIPTRKGDTLTVTYSATGETSAFRFYYAEGEN